MEDGINIGAIYSRQTRSTEAHSLFVLEIVFANVGTI